MGCRDYAFLSEEDVAPMTDTKRISRWTNVTKYIEYRLQFLYTFSVFVRLLTLLTAGYR